MGRCRSHAQTPGGSTMTALRKCRLCGAAFGNRAAHVRTAELDDRRDPAQESCHCVEADRHVSVRKPGPLRRLARRIVRRSRA